jgi:squalene-hopene/tetraprenyl-beta-curcumene cyclase
MNLQVNAERVLLANKTVRADLLAERANDGSWAGQLASSPLATAAAISALVVAHERDAQVELRKSTDSSPDIEEVIQTDLSELFLEAVHWLARQQNGDGGWGDAERARSNIAATMLVQAAFRLTGIPAKYADLMVRADDYVEAQGGVAGLWRQYGNNRTFVAGVLTNCALAGMVSWRQVPTLPFELVCLPKRFSKRLPAPVARYSIPAFIALGRAKHHHDATRNPLTRVVRRALRQKSLAIVERLQAEDGGFNDRIPLTSFVVMSLASIGCQHHRLVERGVEFLLSSVRSDASWSVETGRATWNTMLAVSNLAADSAFHSPESEVQELVAAHDSAEHQHAWAETLHIGESLIETAATHASENHLLHRPNDKADRVDNTTLDERSLNWLLAQQHTKPNVVTEVPPGGWSWRDSESAPPNTIATSGALVALAHWRRRFAQLHIVRIDGAAELAIAWLLAVQNDDGGWSTFYRDDSPLPADTSAVDATAYAVRALAAWAGLQLSMSAGGNQSPDSRRIQSRVNAAETAMDRGILYLQSQQQSDGSFIPSWFGNEHHPDGVSPVYGTALVLTMCAELGRLDTELATRATRWLVSAQHTGGGWGPPRAPIDYSSAEKDGFRAWKANESLAKLCSVEETAIATSALLPLAATNQAANRAVSAGLMWLAGAVENDAHRQGAVVGVYPGKLWYHERLYPLVFATGALTAAVHQLEPQRHTAAPVC